MRVGALLLALIIGLTAGVAITKHSLSGKGVLEAERFLAVDASGKMRASFGVSTDESSVLELADRNGWPRLRLRVQENGTPSASLMDDRDRVRMEMIVTSSGLPEVALRGEDGELRAWLAVDGAGAGALLVRDEKGVLRVMIGPTSFQTTNMKEAREGSLVLLDEKGEASWAAPP